MGVDFPSLPRHEDLIIKLLEAYLPLASCIFGQVRSRRDHAWALCVLSPFLYRRIQSLQEGRAAEFRALSGDDKRFFPNRLLKINKLSPEGEKDMLEE